MEAEAIGVEAEAVEEIAAFTSLIVAYQFFTIFFKKNVFPIIISIYTANSRTFYHLDFFFPIHYDHKVQHNHAQNFLYIY